MLMYLFAQWFINCCNFWCFWAYVYCEKRDAAQNEDCTINNIYVFRFIDVSCEFFCTFEQLLTSYKLIVSPTKNIVHFHCFKSYYYIYFMPCKTGTEIIPERTKTAWTWTDIQTKHSKNVVYTRFTFLRTIMILEKIDVHSEYDSWNLRAWTNLLLLLCFAQQRYICIHMYVKTVQARM